MTTGTIADPFAVSHEAIAEQLEPFCDGDLDASPTTRVLRAYDLATTWTGGLPIADVAAMHIAAEWLVRHGRNLPRFGSDLESVAFPNLAAQFDRAFAELDVAA
jgi:hypothetical protein